MSHKKNIRFFSKKKIFDKQKIFVLRDPIIDMKEFSLKKRESYDFVSPIKQKYLISIEDLLSKKTSNYLLIFFISYQISILNLN